MRIPSIAKITLKRPNLTPEMKRRLAMAAPLALALVIGAMSASSAVHSRFNWVPISHNNIVIDSALRLMLATVLIAVAVCIVLPLAMAFHIVGKAVAGHFFGMRVLAVRVGPVLITPWSITNRFELLAIHGWQDVLTGWVQFDDSPLATWKRLRGWQVAMGGGSVMNLGISFICAIISVFATGIWYVLLRQAVWLNLGAAVVNLIPFAVARFGYESDGKRLLTLVFNEGDGADAMMETLRNEVVVGPIRPASWPRERETAWETSLRATPSSAEGKAEQLETMVYLFLQGVDRGDSEVAWRWVQAMHHVVGSDPENHDIAFETARVMCTLYAARWEKSAESASAIISQISPHSGMTFSPWYTVARAAVTMAEASEATVTRQESLESARSLAALAREQLTEPARLHGVDQLMQGIAQAIYSDADVELQKTAYFEAEAPAKPVIAPDVVAA